SFELPYVGAYLDSLGTNFSCGKLCNIGSTIIPPTSPFYLGVQYTQFKGFKPKTQFIRNQEYFSKALYTFDIGQNDLTGGIFRNTSVQQVTASIPHLVNSFTSNINNIYNLGARSFWIHNTGPIGCLPIILASFLSTEKDSYGCAKAYNEMAQNFNQNLKEALAQLGKDLPLAAITYVDIYSAKYSLFSNPNQNELITFLSSNLCTMRFEFPDVACCGHGGKYNFNHFDGCGGTLKVNGTDVVVGSCKRPSGRVILDGTHYTEAANKVVFDLISSGSFSDPPIPLKMACNRNST
ncbi:hypothetical protein CR513_48900, partial [Mucuna pruriens]